MNMPAFTAETSLYRTAGRYYRIAGPSNGLIAGRGVLPQLPRQLQLLKCLEGCFDQGNPEGCRDNCFWEDFLAGGNGNGGGGGGGGGGNGGPTDAQICAKCKSDCRRGPKSKLNACLKHC